MTPLEIIIKGNTTEANASLQKTQTELAKTASAAAKTDSSLQKFSKSAGQSIFNLTEKLRNLQSAVFTEKDLSKVAAFNQQIKQTEVEIAKMNALGTSSGGLASLGPQFANIGTSATKAFSAVRQLAYILPGVGIAGIIGFATEPIINFISSLFQADDAEKKLQQTVNGTKDSYVLFREELNKVVDSISQEATQVSVLFGALGDSNTNLSDRKTIIKQLNELSPAYLGNLSAEKSSYEQISAAVSSYVDDLGKTAFIKSFLPQFNDIFKKLIDTQVQLRELNLAQKGIFGMSESDYAAEVKRLETAIRLYKQDIQSAKQFLTREAGGALSLQEILFGKKNEEIKIKPEKIKVEKIDRQVLNNAALIKSGEGPNTIKLDLLVKPNFKFEFGDKDAFILGMMQAFFNAEKLKQFQIEATARINETFKSIIQDSVSTFSDSIADALTSGGKDFVPNLFGNLIKGIGGQIKELGKYLVKAGIEMLAAKKAIKALGLTPQTAIIAGIALEVLGALLVSAASKKANNVGFASGTTGVLESGFYNINERGQENVFLPRGTKVQPANEVAAYNGGGITLMPSIAYDGTKLRIFLNRVDAQMSRNN